MTGSYHLEPEAEAVYLSLFVAGLAYSGLHLLAWSPPVRTYVETVIWRISGISTIVYGVIPGLFGCSQKAFDASRRPTLLTCGLRWLREYVNGAWSALRWLVWFFAGAILCLLYMNSLMITIPLFVASTVLYVLARVYLVVECFISVARLPESVFETPAWASYLPHFG
ncbi:hypothetical protein MFIFM68171_02614 [Madurella fahalii]|uniref:Uncharacterized protein n=1 Tax=Madurella fahalii TaxID=1157608 RepID=A0ABQ0G422_9PEZI